MLGGAIGLLSGRSSLHSAGGGDVLQMAASGIRARTNLNIEIRSHGSDHRSIPAPAALVLVQFAVNAAVHDGVTSVRLSADGRRCFHVDWEPPAANGPLIVSSRQYAGRRRWGLGYTKIAADHLGGVAFAPYRAGAHVRATLDLTGRPQVRLPLACVKRGEVTRASRGWEEEVGSVGCAVSDAHLQRIVEASMRDPGTIHVADRFPTASASGGRIAARAQSDSVWLALPPDNMRERALDAIKGLHHEDALWRGAPEPHRSDVYALASLLHSSLTGEWDTCSGPTWSRRYQQACGSLGVVPSTIDFDGRSALDPRVCLYIVRTLGARLSGCDGELVLHVDARHQHDPLIAVLQATPRAPLRVRSTTAEAAER